MSHNDSALLAKISKSCFFRLQPQPLVDLLNSRGIVGRPAEVFWTYFHWGFQNGTFSCQLSSSYIAEALFTDVRTVQRANERLVEAGLITRTRAKRIYGTHLEAPAITTISIPDDEVRASLESAPRRASESTDGPGALEAPTRNPTSTSDTGLSFTAVNSQDQKSPQTDPSPSRPSPTPQPCKSDQKAAIASLEEIKRSLPQPVQRLHDMCMVKASPSVFKQALDELGSIPEDQVEVLMAPLVKALECKRRELRAIQQPSKKPAKGESEGRVAKVSSTHARPDEPRPIPARLISFIEDRLKAKLNSMPKNYRSVLLKEIVYSVTIGTLRGLDLMHAINTTIKLASSRKWSTPLGMPEGWSYSHVLLSDHSVQAVA